MKNTFIIFSTLLLCILFSCKKEEPQNVSFDLSGDWIGYGYECPQDIYHDEQISITHNLETGELVATKITGDDCVTAGNVSFRGLYDGLSDRFDAEATAGVPGNPNSSLIKISFRVINNDLFTDSAYKGGVFVRE